VRYGARQYPCISGKLSYGIFNIERKEDIAITNDQIFKNPILLVMASKAREDVFKENALPHFASLEGLNIRQIVCDAVSQCRVREEQIKDICFANAKQGDWMSVNLNKSTGTLVKGSFKSSFSSKVH
jgi:hypothetical protein